MIYTNRDLGDNTRERRRHALNLPVLLLQSRTLNCYLEQAIEIVEGCYNIYRSFLNAYTLFINRNRITLI